MDLLNSIKHGWLDRLRPRNDNAIPGTRQTYPPVKRRRTAPEYLRMARTLHTNHLTMVAYTN
ncbi:uncharacterized protein QC763_0084090 [Podospora pseudopauciseta]|uniref:Uncharacterized protein n=1 Tax=Podospora pseudopauciseta TaxID=2093780 RepID=A0ABR0H8Q7_9PEZI|nr:hypothetical protein QC763_0084090 [Podospora pseudopauciseta]